MADNQGGVNGNDQHLPNGPRQYTELKQMNFVAALNNRDALGATAEGQGTLSVFDEADSEDLPNPVKNRRLVYRIVEYHCDNIKEILREMRIIRQAEVTLKDLTSQMEMESIKNPDHNPEDDDNDWESDNDWHLMVAGERALYDGEEIIKCNKKNE
ncbi:hypothetical protein HCN44_007210 [Aphidius gifuensis]|uniref:Uncharacterized protein n=1 Tax=Aphidius gifuensis TaxID=684658 RepID=A0A834XP83_APHGI|nr:hypothetical protein HCN44_007210 [Aphidius gifuensis]